MVEEMLARAYTSSADEETKWLVGQDKGGHWALYERYFRGGLRLFGDKKIADLDQAVVERWEKIIRHRNRIDRPTWILTVAILPVGGILQYFVTKHYLIWILGIWCFLVFTGLFWSEHEFPKSIPKVQALLKEIGLGHIPAMAVRGPGDNRASW